MILNSSTPFDGTTILNKMTNLESEMSSLNSSMTNLSNSYSNISTRVTTLEKNVNADVLKATEVIPAVSQTQVYPNSSTYSISLSNDKTSYNKVRVKVPAHTLEVKNTSGSTFKTIEVPNQYIQITRGNTASITFVNLVTETSQYLIGHFVLGFTSIALSSLTGGGSLHSSAGIVALRINYRTGSLTLSDLNKGNKSYININSNVITVEYY